MIKIEADRESMCAADDQKSHNKFFEFDDQVSIEELIVFLNSDEEYSNFMYCAIWAGEHNNFKCIRDNKGNWLIDKTIKADEFFNDIKNYIYFERISKKCEKKKNWIQRWL